MHPPGGLVTGFYQRLFRRPPSTFGETPVMKLARSEHKKATASAGSSGRPQRPSAFLRAASRRASSSEPTPSSATSPGTLRFHMPVSTQPGHTALTRTLSAPSSVDSALVTLSRALLV